MGVGAGDRRGEEARRKEKEKEEAYKEKLIEPLTVVWKKRFYRFVCTKKKGIHMYISHQPLNIEMQRRRGIDNKRALAR